MGVADIVFEPSARRADVGDALVSSGRGATLAVSSVKKSAAPSSRIGVKVMLHPDTLERVRYWSSKDGLSANEFIVAAVERSIATRNQDYDLPSLEAQRLSQIVDQLKALSDNTANLERVVYDGLGSLLSLARGDDYLLSVEPEV